MPDDASVPAREQRTAVRFATALTVRLADGTGRTHNLSNTGVYFEVVKGPRLGTLVNFTLEYRLHGRRQQLECEGKVVRVDPLGERAGVAARLVSPLFRPQERG